MKQNSCSIIIPTYNRKSILKTTLTALVKQDYPKNNYEIIVIDDGSTDGTEDMVKKFKSKFSKPVIKYFYQEKKGYRPGAARNIGIKNADNEIIIFIDSDIVVAHDFIQEHMKSHINNNIICIGYTAGLMGREFYNINKISKIINNNYYDLRNLKIIPEYRESFYFECSDNINQLQSPWVTFITNNISVLKKHLVDVGMFDEEFNGWGLEDLELGYKLYKKSLNFVLNRNALGFHIGNDVIRNPFLNKKSSSFKIYAKNMELFYKKHPLREVKRELIKHNLIIPEKYRIFRNESKIHKIKLGNICNNNCVFCKILDKKAKRNKSFHEIKEELELIANREELIISGGEPTIRKDIFDIISYAKKLGFKKITLETNGRMFYFKDFCERIIKTGVDKFNIYIYGYDADIHEKITQVIGSFEQTTEGIKNLKSLCGEIRINIILSKDNHSSLTNTINFLKSMNIKNYSQKILDVEFVEENTIDLLPKDNLKLKYDNHILSWQEYQEGKLVLESMPSRIFVELTQNCNFRCIMCRHSQLKRFKKYNPEYNMPFDLFKKVADLFFPYATFVDLRGYGESTILPYWSKIVKYISKFSNIQWHVNTNLSLARKDIWNNMIRNNFIIAFSCDGATQKTFEFIRRGSNFSQIKKNLNTITELIKKYQKGGIYFLTTVQRYNLMELPEIIEMAKKYDVGCIALRMVQEYSEPYRFIPNQPPEMIRKIIKEIIELSKKYKINLDINDNELAKYIPPKLKQKKYYSNPTWFVKEVFPYEPFKHHSEAVSVNKRCFKPFGYVYVYYDGQIGPCNHLGYPPISLGNLNKESFKEIWNGKSFQKFRNNLLNATPELPDCKWCFKHRITD